ncbi:MAG: SIR2 family protein [Clostridia bacterium]|nr:SIR2 family protein [Clostridia bacterium]
MVEITEFEKNYIKAIQDGSAAIFAGAGIGRSSGYMDWKNLLKEFADSINLDIERESDLIEVAQYFKNEKGSRYDINSKILNEFLREAKNTRTVDLLASMPIFYYWTTNYDHLIEDALKNQGKAVDTKITSDSLAVSLNNQAVTVYKMHGDCIDPSNCVITKDDYEIYNQKRNVFTIALQGHLVTKTFLFVGFSFEDPNLKYILSRIRTLLGENIRTHYCFFEKVTRKPGQTKKEFEYIRNKQELKIHDLQRYGIQAVMLDSYTQIPEILEHIKLQARTKNIFISGAAHTYGNNWDKTGVKLITLLSKLFYDNEYRIVTGHARGVGSYIISTLLENIQKDNSPLESHLLIRAFPYEDKDNPKYVSLKKEYRDSIAEISGITIFIFGNKENENGECVQASGMWDEYKSALTHNSYIIPVGSTGFVARDIFEEMNKNRDRFPYLTSKDFDILGTSTNPETIVNQIREILLRIKKL